MSHFPSIGRAAAARGALAFGSGCLVVCLVACGGGGGDSATAAPSAASAATSPAGAASAAATVHATATAVTTEPAGKNCAAAGTRIDAGLDQNDNGKLDAAEVATTQYVCNGKVGATGLAGPAALVKISAEPAGTHCAQGGSLVAAGVDGSGNGALEATEITSSSYVCNGSAGAAAGAAATRVHSSLVVAAAEPAGVKCTYGGTRITAGLDANDSGVLDAGEVTSTSYSCNGAPGAPGATGATGATGAPGATGATGPAGGGSGSSSAVATWTRVTGVAQAMAANGSYLADNPAQVVLTLPASPAVGDVVNVFGQGTGGWKIAQNAGQAMIVKGLPNGLAAGTAWSARAPSDDWVAVASSADGNRLVAATQQAQLYTSADAGATWTARDSARSWKAVASSASGLRLVAAAAGDTLFVSSDGGVNWTARDSVRNWSAVAPSASGTRLVATESGGGIYTSTDAGVSWTAQASPVGTWTAVASSSDGLSLVAAATGDFLYTSGDAGVTWTPRDSVRNWTSVATSADGITLVAVDQGSGSGGQLYTSADAGATWTPRSGAVAGAALAGGRNWQSVTSSADGTRLLAAAFNEQLYTSVDGGASWTARETARAWSAVASSADGSHLLAGAILSETLYTSVNDRTSVGTAGFLSGSQYDAVGLIYLGNNVFAVRDSTSYSGLFGAF